MVIATLYTSIGIGYWVLVSLETNIIGYWILGASVDIVLTLAVCVTVCLLGLAGESDVFLSSGPRYRRHFAFTSVTVAGQDWNDLGHSLH